MAEGLSIALPLSISSRDGAYKVHDEIIDVAQQSLKMIILTSPGERVMSPKFGVGVRSFLFEQNTPGFAARLRTAVAKQVTTYLPYVRLNDLIVSSNPGENTISLQINYSIPSSGITDEFMFPVSP